MNTPSTQKYKRVSLLLVLAMVLMLGDGCNKPASTSSSSASKPKIGYVLHGLSDFTQTIKQGAEDAARAENVSV
ncbi:MAG TPA: hypothetical protein VMZ27_09205, partial [Candidatus Saccharimonadales bacterium]|nr:hypothetical protein [Candidatus Saccharimonadales bacterium]